MKGSDIARALPSGHGTKREKQIYDAVRLRQLAPISWSTITTKAGGKTAYFKVTSDALRVGDATDSFRPTVTHRTAQLIADDLGAFLLTPKLADEAHAQAKVVISPRPRLSWKNDGTMSNTKRMVEQSASVDKMIAGRPGLVSSVGKDWVNTNAFAARCKIGPKRDQCAVNYGWHGKGLPYRAATPRGGALYQPVGFKHNLGHVDYSQIVRLVQPMVRLCDDEDGTCQEVHIQKIASDPVLAALLSHEGPLTLRHPGVTANCPIRGACPGPGTPLKKKSPPPDPPVTVLPKGSPPCPEFDCDDLPPPVPISPAGVGPAMPLLIFVAAGAAGFFAARVFLPHLGE